MDTDIQSGAIGNVGKYDVAFKGGKLVVEADGDKGPVSVGVNVSIDARQVLDAIAAAIPGKLDDAVIAVLEAGLLGA